MVNFYVTADTTVVEGNIRVIEDRLTRNRTKALMKGAEGIAKLAREYCPVDTGRLRDSIVARLAGSEEASVTASTPYAGFVEFGTRYMYPRYYMTRAFENYLSQYYIDVEEVVQESLG